MREEQKREKGGMQGRKNRLSILVVTLAIISCITVVAGIGYSICTNSQPVEASILRLQVKGNVKTRILNGPEGRQRELDTIAEEGMVAFFINVTPYIQDGKGKANFMTKSPLGSGNRFTTGISRDDTGEEVYYFEYIEPEQYIDKASLNVGLSKGEYVYIASFDTYRLGKDIYTGRATAKITLYVLE